VKKALVFLLCIISVFVFIPCSWAEIVEEGDVASQNSYEYEIGRYEDGTVTVNNGSGLGKFSRVLVGNGYRREIPGTGYLGNYNPIGTLNIDGYGSLVEANNIYLGAKSNYGTHGIGIVNLTNGGKMKIDYWNVTISEGSELNIEVTGDKMVTVGHNVSHYNAFNNSGTVTFTADEGLDAGVYKPIWMTYGDNGYPGYSGDGLYEAFGGIWDDTDHTFTVAESVSGAAGEDVTLDLSQNQRFHIDDQVRVQFMAQDTDVTFAASVIDEDAMTLLTSFLTTDDSILNGWLFDFEDGYTEGDPVYLSLLAGEDYDLSDLTLWHFDDENSEWSVYESSDLTYDGQFANFSVTGFSGYAVTSSASVPLPSAVILLGSGLATLVGFRRKFKKS
jgi:hypothetical protein